MTKNFEVNTENGTPIIDSINVDSSRIYITFAKGNLYRLKQAPSTWRFVFNSDLDPDGCSVFDLDEHDFGDEKLAVEYALGKDYKVWAFIAEEDVDIDITTITSMDSILNSKEIDECMRSADDLLSEMAKKSDLLQRYKKALARYKKLFIIDDKPKDMSKKTIDELFEAILELTSVVEELVVEGLVESPPNFNIPDAVKIITEYNA